MAGLVVGMYDDESEVLLLCCTICGQSVSIETSEDEVEFDMEGLIEHSKTCFVPSMYERKMN